MNGFSKHSHLPQYSQIMQRAVATRPEGILGTRPPARVWRFTLASASTPLGSNRFCSGRVVGDPEGESVNTIRIRLGYESLDVTLAYLKGKNAESEEAQEHANSSRLALYA